MIVKRLMKSNEVSHASELGLEFRVKRIRCLKKLDLLLSPWSPSLTTAISVVHFTPNAYLISRKTITKLTLLPSNS